MHTEMKLLLYNNVWSYLKQKRYVTTPLAATRAPHATKSTHRRKCHSTSKAWQSAITQQVNWARNACKYRRRKSPSMDAWWSVGEWRLKDGGAGYRIWNELTSKSAICCLYDLQCIERAVYIELQQQYHCRTEKTSKILAQNPDAQQAKRTPWKCKKLSKALWQESTAPLVRNFWLIYGKSTAYSWSTIHNPECIHN